MIFRLTIGENGTAWGKQKVLCTATAENALEFIKNCIQAAKEKDSEYAEYLKRNSWVDAGSNTIPIRVANFKI